MAEGIINYRANLSAAKFPFQFGDEGQTVIDAGADQNYDRRVDPEGNSYAVGIPQALYMDNVIPSAEGYQTVDAEQTTALTTDYFKQFEVTCAMNSVDYGDRFIKVRIFVNVGTANLWAKTAQGQAISFSQAFEIPGLAHTDHKFITHMESIVVGTRTFILVRVSDGSASRLWEIKHNLGIFTCAEVTTTPANFVADNKIIAGCGAWGYMVLASAKTIYYSSLTDPLNFVSSLSSGAGSIVPSANDSNILHLRASPGGFYIFTGTKILHSAYTGNNRYPWKFSPLGNSGYVPLPENAYVNQEDSFGIVSTGHGNIAAVSEQGVENIAPELSTFFERALRVDLFNYTSDEMEQGVNVQQNAGYFMDSVGIKLGKQLPVTVLNDRYILVSAGRSSSTFTVGEYSTTFHMYSVVYVFDKVLKRYGRLRVPHSQMFTSSGVLELYNPLTNKIIWIKLNLDASLNVSGTTYLLDKLLVLGRFQLSRGNRLHLQRVEMERPATKTGGIEVFGCRAEVSMDGKTRYGAGLNSLYNLSSAGGKKTYLANLMAYSINLYVVGSFHLTSLSLQAADGGDR